MHEAATAATKTSSLAPLQLPGAVKSPRKPPLPLPPKSPKRYGSNSSKGAVSPTPSLPRASGSLASSAASCSTSPVESYFDALSIAPVTPREQLSPSSQTWKLPIGGSSTTSPPPFHRRESAASSACLSDEEAASRAYAQRQTERRTSVLPLPSPDAPHSQRTRHRRRPPSGYGAASSQTSLSSAAGSLYASETESQASESQIPMKKERGHTLSPKSKARRLTSQPRSPSPTSLSSTLIQARSSAEHPYSARDSHASASISTFSRTRSSQATSLGPFDLEGPSSPSEELKSKDLQLQRDFFDSIGRPSSSRSNGTSSRLSMPSSPGSFATTEAGRTYPFDAAYRPTSEAQAIASASRNASQIRQAKNSEPEWAIPIIRNSPLATSPGRSPISEGLAPDSDTQEEHGSYSIPQIDPTRDGLQLTLPKSRRASSGSSTRKRVGRIYSAATVTVDTFADELRTPRVSVSSQGRLAESIYSTADTAPDTFPYMADTSKDLPEQPREEEHASLGLGFPLKDSRTPIFDHYSLTEEDKEDEEVFKQPGTSRYSMFNGSSVSSAHSPTDEIGEHRALPPTPYSSTFRNSVNSLTSSLNLPQTTPSDNLSEEEKKQYKRARIIHELVQTEEDFSRDMALVRDVWLARARGKEMGEIMATLEAQMSRSRPISSTSSNLAMPKNSEAGDQTSGIRLVERKASAPQMQRNTSQSSFNSFKDRVTSLGKSVPDKSSSVRAASYGGAPRQRSLSNVQPLPPGAALYAPMRQLDAEIIFGNIEAVASFSSQFAAILSEEQTDEESGRREAGIGQAFLAMLPRLSTVYSVYCAHFGDAMQRWESLAESLAPYSRDCKDLCYGYTNAWDLPSLLIKPVQRCLKYPLFIQSLLECTPESHPDKESLESSSSSMLKVAESINEMKRRHEIVTKLIKRKARSGLYGNTRRGSDKAVPSATKTPSGGSFTSSLSRKFKRSSRIGISEGLGNAGVPEPDEDFESLLVQLETKHRVIQSFVLDSKSWSKSVKTAMVALLQLSLAWKNISSLDGQDETEQATQSSRTIEYFAVSVVRATIEDQWRDMDQEIRKILIPKATQLLELFSGPRSAIATRYHRYSESRSKAASKDNALLREHASAYYALNAQLKEELPVFLQGVDRIFIAMVQRFVTLQIAFDERMAEAWREYIQSCCTQLGPPDQTASESVTQWWQMHGELAQQLDSLNILAADKVIEDVQRRQRNSLPPGLRPRRSSGRSSVPSGSKTERNMPRRTSRQQHEDSNALTHSAHPGHTTLSMPSASRSGQTGIDPLNRNSTFSSTSAGSLSFSGQSGYSAASPPTPVPGHSVLWQGAVATSFRPSGHKAPVKGYHFLSCEPGDLFEVLDESSGEKHFLVRHEGTYGDVGWLPAHLLHRLE